MYRRDRRVFDRDRLPVVRADVLFQSRYVSIVENSEFNILFLRLYCTVRGQLKFRDEARRTFEQNISSN